MQKGMTLAKTIIGKDMSTFSLPAFLNEPTTILMKIAESFMFSDLLIKASREPDPARRMTHIVSFIAASQWVVNNRVSKPFISLLGETYELVTPKFKFIAECVKSLPCVVAYHVSGDGFVAYKTCEGKM